MLRSIFATGQGEPGESINYTAAATTTASELPQRLAGQWWAGGETQHTPVLLHSSAANHGPGDY